LGRIGIVICAETRSPEIVASLASDGAEIVAMPTCWINGASEPDQYSNPQTDFLMEARAREFSVPVVCADKWGFEQGTVGYVGMSRVYRADGSIAAEAPPTGDTVIAARIVRHPPARVWVSDARRKRILSDRPALPPAADSARSVTLAAMPTVVADERFTGGMGEGMFEPLRDKGVDLVLLNMPHEQSAEHVAMLANAYDMRAIGFPIRADVFDLGPARVGCVAGQWARSFAAARALALDGAEVLLFFDVPNDLAILRARALENRVFVIGVSSRFAVIIGPNGEVLAKCSSAQPTEVIARVDLADAGNKTVAPETDIFNERRPRICHF
jgi:predicted amidohydrolase